MGQTVNFKIPYPEGTDAYAPLHTHFANIAQATDAAILSGVAGSARAAGSVAQRNTIFPNPVQGNLVYRTDRGYIEQYHATYASSSNPLGATPGGWYPFLGRLPEIYLPLSGIQELKPDNPGTAQTISRAIASGTYGTPKVSPGASDYFTVDANRNITFTRSCEVNISWALTQVGGAGDGSGRVIATVNDNTWSIPAVATRVVGESEQPYSKFRQWHLADIPHSAFSAGDVLRFGFYANSILDAMTFGTAALARACYIRVMVTGPRSD